MKKLITLILLLVSAMIYGQKKSFIETIEKGDINIELVFNSRLSLLQDLEESMRVQMWDSTRYVEEKSHIPGFGVLFVKIKGTSIDNGNPSYYEFLVQDSTEIQYIRKKGNDRIPKYFISKYRPTEWFGTDYIVLDKKLGEIFSVYVFDGVSNQRWKFLIYPLIIINK